MNMVNWEDAPEGTVCFAKEHFRDSDGLWWDYADNSWNESRYTQLEISNAEDYEPNPYLITDNESGAIKSDGGSSSYYDIPLPDWLINLIVERRYIKTEELIEVLGGDFDEANILKCLVRINSLRNGKGKEGNTVDYDCNKISYSANRIKEVESR